MENPNNKPANSGQKSGPIRWKYGQESDFYLLVKDWSGNWFAPLYSHDVVNKFIRKGESGTLADPEKIARLKALFARGGTRGISFQPENVAVALIVPNGKKAADAIEKWTPGKRWHNPASRSENPARTGAANHWKLWMNSRPTFTLAVQRDSPEIRQFSGELLEKRPDLCERYTDPESGELSVDFVMALYLGMVARSRVALADRAYLYRAGSSKPDLRIDIVSGRVCGIGQGAGWVNPAFFFNS